MNPFRRTVIIALTLLCALTAVAGTEAGREASRSASLGDQLYYLHDSRHRLTLEEILARKDELQWQKSQEMVPNLGMTPDTIWFRTTLANPAPVARDYWLELGYSKLDRVMLYLLRNEEVVQQQAFGDLVPFWKRPIKHRNFLVPVTLPAESRTQLYLRVQSGGALQVPLELWEKEHFLEQDQDIFAQQMIFAGLMAALGLYNLMLLFSIRDISYLWYVINVFSIALAQLSISGITFQYLWPAWPQLNNVSLVALFSLSLTSGSLFTYHFLQLPKYNRVCAWLVLAIAACGGAMFVASFVVDYALMITTISLSAAVFTPVILAVSIYLWVKGVRLARIYTFAWGFLLAGHTLQAMSKLGYLPRTEWLEHAPQVGTSIELLLLSFALAYRFNEERRQRIQAQNEALKVQQEANIELESRVQARTLELENANRRLQALSSVDGLTQVKNRGFFDEALQLEWRKSTRRQSGVALLMIDVDHFKEFNDNYGHQCGDGCLRHLAGLFEGSVGRAGDMVSRYGGEEFAILLPDSSASGATRVGERVQAAIADTPFCWEGRQIPLTVSIGIACTTPTRETGPEELVRQADEALYKAKRLGRNRIEVFQASDD